MELAWNTQKNQMTDVKGKEMEQERKGKISNEDIDLDRTKNNYDLVESKQNLYERVKERVDELKVEGSRVQKNSVVMYSNILTVPNEQAEKWGEKKTDDYFKSCYDFFCNEFGKENVVSAKIHKDETTPHMHLHFVPVNKENGKLQARVSMNKKKIYYIHDELPKFLKEKGFEVERASGKTKDKNIEDIHEFKEVKKAINEQENKLEKMKEEINDLTILKEPKKEIDRIDKSVKKSKFSDKMSLPSEDYQKLKSIAESSAKVKYISQKKMIAEREKNRDLKASVQRADQRADKFKNRANELEEQLEGTTEKLIESRKNEIVFKSKLQDNNQDLNISELEKEGRLIMFNLENGRNPKNEQEGEEWLSVLQENKKAKTIPENRLEGFLERLKSFLSKFLKRDNEFSLEGLKRKSEEIKRERKPRKSKSWDMER